MAHDFNLTHVRGIGYGIIKVVKRIFDGIYVNMAQLKKVRELAKHDSVIFVPSHRSYMDFLLVSLLCFDQEIPLPAICAGSDFQSSYLLGEALRKCGAFFIKRSFGEDAFYWSIFNEYVQAHISNGDRTFEFFIEAQRSRTNKSRRPKYGLLQSVLEPYVRSEVLDLVFVPVTINYDKRPEEWLYAYELLGFPKPKETTSGLLKARQILDRCYGNVYVTFGKPISIRQRFNGVIDRSISAFDPRSQFRLNGTDKQAIRRFAHEVVVTLDQNSTISIWPLACAALLHISSDNPPFDDSIKFDDLSALVTRYFDLVTSLGVRVRISNSIDADLRYYIRLNDDFVKLSERNGVSYVTVQHVEDVNGVKNKTLTQSVSAIILSNYANQVTGLIARSALAAMALLAIGDNTESAKEDFCFLRQILDREFVFIPHQLDTDWAKTFAELVSSGFVSSSGTPERVGDLRLLADMVQPVVDAYWLAMRLFSSGSYTSSNFVNEWRRKMGQQLSETDATLRGLSMLSGDIAKNAVDSLLAKNALKVQATSNTLEGTSAIPSIMARLGKYVPPATKTMLRERASL
ncbi:CRE-ACL-7 protein [Aphelenchoides avenae]|nr:CRE-ACL-7 protein [Aphelenchus avenae]